MTTSNDAFYLKVWNETNRRARAKKKYGDHAWNRIWAEVHKELSQKRERNES